MTECCMKGTDRRADSDLDKGRGVGKEKGVKRYGKDVAGMHAVEGVLEPALAPVMDALETGVMIQWEHCFLIIACVG